MKAGVEIALIGYWVLIVALAIRDIGKMVCEQPYQYTPINALSVVVVLTITLLVGYYTGRAAAK